MLRLNRRTDWSRLRWLLELAGAAVLGGGVYLAVVLVFSLA